MIKKNDERDIPVRRHIIMYLNIFDIVSGHQIGWLGDISENGIMIISNKRIVEEKPICIRLKLPNSSEFHGDSVELSIELLWSRPDKNPRYFCQGGLITKIPDESKKDIEILIEKFGLADNRSLKEYTNYTD